MCPGAQLGSLLVVLSEDGVFFSKARTCKTSGMRTKDSHGTEKHSRSLTPSPIVRGNVEFFLRENSSVCFLPIGFSNRNLAMELDIGAWNPCYSE